MFITFPGWALGRKTWKRSTLGVYAAAVLGFMRFCIIENYVDFDDKQRMRRDMAFEKIQRHNPVRIPREVHEADVLAILQAAREFPINPKGKVSVERQEIIKARNLALVVYLAHSGSRNEEACKIHVKDMDFERLRLIVIGKGNKEGVIRFSSEAAGLIKDYWKLSGIGQPTDPVFCREDWGRRPEEGRQPMSTATPRNVIHMLAKMAGVSPSFVVHSMRHYAITKMYRVDNDLKAAQIFARHASTQMTDHYTHLEDVEVEDTYRKAFEKG
jgi:integrase